MRYLLMAGALILGGCGAGEIAEDTGAAGADFVFLSDWEEQACDPHDTLGYAEFTVPDGALYMAEDFRNSADFGDTWIETVGYRSGDVVFAPCWGESARVRYVQAR